MFRSVAITLALCLATVTAQAALLGRAALTPGGTDYQAYYDDVLDITWQTNANLAFTNSFGVAGTIKANGSMNWYTAIEWIGAMNTANYLGISDWRLPAVVDTGTQGCNWSVSGTDCGYNLDLATGELAHLYYSTLDNKGAYNPDGSDSGCMQYQNQNQNYGPPCFANMGPFTNFQTDLQIMLYWAGTIDTSQADSAWQFRFAYGDQGSVGMGYSNVFAWAVTDGDALVPVPGAVWLFSSALGLMGWMRRKVTT